MEIHQYWTVPRQTQRMTTPSFAKKWRLQYNHWRKGSQLESTTSQQNLSKWVERLSSSLSQQSATRSCRQKNGQPPWTQSCVMALPKKGNLQQCQNYRTTSLINHTSKVTLNIVLNRLKPQTEKIIAEEQAGSRAGRSITEHIFNLRILCDKYHQHQPDLYQVFIDFKKAFDRVWHAALGASMKKYNISANLVRVINYLNNKATSAALSNSRSGDWFRKTAGV